MQFLHHLFLKLNDNPASKLEQKDRNTSLRLNEDALNTSRMKPAPDYSNLTSESNHHKTRNQDRQTQRQRSPLAQIEDMGWMPH